MIKTNLLLIFYLPLIVYVLGFTETLLPWKQKNQPIICRRSKAPVTRTLFFLSLLTIATASGFAGYLIGVNLCWRSIFNKEHIVYLLLGYGLKHFVKGRVYVVCPDDRTF